MTPRLRVGRLDLVLAVACLGMLAAVALPRQRELTARNHLTEVQALADSVRSAAQFGHSLWLARGQPAALDVRGQRVRIVNGYPDSTDLALLLEEPEAMGFARTGGAWHREDTRGEQSCGVSYAPPIAPAQPPSISLFTKGC